MIPRFFTLALCLSSSFALVSAAGSPTAHPDAPWHARWIAPAEPAPPQNLWNSDPRTVTLPEKTPTAPLPHAVDAK